MLSSQVSALMEKSVEYHKLVIHQLYMSSETRLILLRELILRLIKIVLYDYTEMYMVNEMPDSAEKVVEVYTSLVPRPGGAYQLVPPQEVHRSDDHKTN